MMKAFQIKAGCGLVGLEPVERAGRELAGDEIRVRVNAAALNYRDLSLAKGQFYNPPVIHSCPLLTDAVRSLLWARQ
jgi:NADPH:quinone reductase-like Zn-dependent oxidoreductase